MEFKTIPCHESLRPFIRNYWILNAWCTAPGEILPYRLPNTDVIGTISCKFFSRPDKEHVDDKSLVPDVLLDLSDKDKAFSSILDMFK